MKVQVQDNGIENRSSGTGPVHCATTRVNRRVVGSDPNNNSNMYSHQLKNRGAGKTDGGGNGHRNIRQRPASPSHRTLSNVQDAKGANNSYNISAEIMLHTRIEPAMWMFINSRHLSSYQLVYGMLTCLRELEI